MGIRRSGKLLVGYRASRISDIRGMLASTQKTPKLTMMLRRYDAQAKASRGTVATLIRWAVDWARSFHHHGT